MIGLLSSFHFAALIFELTSVLQNTGLKIILVSIYLEESESSLKRVSASILFIRQSMDCHD